MAFCAWSGPLYGPAVSANRRERCRRHRWPGLGRAGRTCWSEQGLLQFYGIRHATRVPGDGRRSRAGMLAHAEELMADAVGASYAFLSSLWQFHVGQGSDDGGRRRRQWAAGRWRFPPIRRRGADPGRLATPLDHPAGSVLESELLGEQASHDWTVAGSRRRIRHRTDASWPPCRWPMTGTPPTSCSRP